MKNHVNPQEVPLTDVFYVGFHHWLLTLRVINVTSKFRVLFGVKFAKHSPGVLSNLS